MFACVLGVAACTDEDADKPATGSPDAGQAADTDAAAPETGPITSDQEALTLTTDEFQLDAGQERYLCFATTLDEDAVIDAYSSEAQPFVHHIVFVRTLAPEPDGFAECDTLFRMTWDPLYISGAGASKLQFPENAGHKLTKGTQLLAQLHLLNASDDAVRGRVSIHMHRSTASDPRPVSTYVFGTRRIELPPNQASDITSDCEMSEPVQLIAAFPHLHQLGTALHFEVGDSTDDMKEVYARDPYSFDDQHIEDIDLKLDKGAKTRVTCSYDNDTPDEVTFGESTHDEMCFFIAFALDRTKITSCGAGEQEMPKH
jgi:hypothetical protein